MNKNQKIKELEEEVLYLKKELTGTQKEFEELLKLLSIEREDYIYQKELGSVFDVPVYVGGKEIRTRLVQKQPKKKVGRPKKKK